MSYPFISLTRNLELVRKTRSQRNKIKTNGEIKHIRYTIQ